MYILFDIGGTKMRLAALPVGALSDTSSKDNELFGAVLKKETPGDDFEAGMKQFEDMVREISGGEKIEGLAGGIAGPLDRARSKLVNSPNITGWVGEPLKERLGEMFGAPVFLENDSAVVGLGEATVGAGKGAEIAAYITVSTGVGGARIVNGKIDKSAFGFEPGHQIVDIHEEANICNVCGVAGDLESIISGGAMEKRYHEKPYNITDEKIWDEEARLLAFGLNNITMLWSPDVIVLGGSMIVRTPGISVERVRGYFKETIKIFPELPEIRKAELKDEGGLHGAHALLRQNLPQ